MKLKLRFITPLVLLSIFNLNCMQEEKLEHENKSEFENLEYEQKTIYDKNLVIGKHIRTLCKLSKRRIAVANEHGKINIFNIDSGKKEKSIKTNDQYIIKMLEIPENRLVTMSTPYCCVAFEALIDPTKIKIWDLNSFFSKKLIDITINQDDPNPPFSDGVFYLKDNVLIITMITETYKIDLNKKTVDKFPYKIIYIKQLADGNLACRERNGIIRILNKDFEKIYKIKPNEVILRHMKMLPDKKSFIVSLYPIKDSKKFAYIFTNEKFNFEEIKKNLKDKIPIPDLQQIILDYLSDSWQHEKLIENENQANENHLNGFDVLSNNKLINKFQFNRSKQIQLWNLNPLKFIKNITETPDSSKTISFKDGTIVISKAYSVKIFKQKTNLS